MKLKFKDQAFQKRAVDAVIDCFEGQPYHSGITYRYDPGVKKFADGSTSEIHSDESGFSNEEIRLSDAQLLENIRSVQRKQNLPISTELFKDDISRINLDIEMETGTGKTYCYIKTMFEMHKRYGWSKFIVVVPSIAIREGVYKSFQITADHFLEAYGTKAKFFIYNSKTLHDIESFSTDAKINVMIINVQAFNARGKDNRRIYEELDDFQTRRPIDVIKKNKPILIIDEPQKMEGKATKKSLSEFNALMVLRYSATHKEAHNKIHRLDALDAYNQKLVKKIAVRGISVKGLTGTNSYLYLSSIEVSKHAPVARIEMEVKQASGIKRIVKRLTKGARLFDESGGLAQYNNIVLNDINANTDTVYFSNGLELKAGEATGNLDEPMLRRIQIREAIYAHFEKERELFHQGIKVLTLFFIDEVAKYRVYKDNEEEGGEYARMFEEEYRDFINEDNGLFISPDYEKHVRAIDVSKTHNGYFSIDKKTKRMVDSEFDKKEKTSDDVDAYDLILKDKERLLSFDEPVRFIFSHSALREGWDNPNVFVICFLKHSDKDIPRRQEVGRGLRLSVDKFGDRQDKPSTVHQINVLTVVANESYNDFVEGLQNDIVEALSDRPRKADIDYFKNKIISSGDETVEVTEQMAKQIYKYLVKNDYSDDNDSISEKYYTDAKNKALAPLPDELKQYEVGIHWLIESVLTNANIPTIEDGRKNKINPLNSNFHKKEFHELWNRINKQAVYKVEFDTNELIEKAVRALNGELRVRYLEYTVVTGTQKDEIEYEKLKSGESFRQQDSKIQRNVGSVHSSVTYDLIGDVAAATILTRKTVTSILSKIERSVFEQFKSNPEHFIKECSRLIKEQKASMVIERLTYDQLNGSYETDIFTDAQNNQNFSKAGEKLNKHVFDYCITDSINERSFVNELDTSSEVEVYAKLPRGFAIPTPVGDYNPDWAIAFKDGTVKHIYFVAETKGSMSSMQLRHIEEIKIKCATKFFEELNRNISSDKVKYSRIDGYEQLMRVVN